MKSFTVGFLLCLVWTIGISGCFGEDKEREIVADSKGYQCLQKIEGMESKIEELELKTSEIDDLESRVVFLEVQPR